MDESGEKNVVPQPNEGAPAEVDSEKKQTFSRRDFLKVAGLVSAALGAGEVSRWVSPIKKEAGSTELSFELLAREIYPVTLEQSKEAVRYLAQVKELNKLDNIEGSYEEIPKVFKAVADLRNYAIFNKGAADQMCELMLEYSDFDPFAEIDLDAGDIYQEGWSPRILNANLRNITKLEMFYAMRNLESRNLTARKYSEEVIFTGLVSYTPSEIAGIFTTSTRIPQKPGDKHISSIYDLNFGSPIPETNSLTHTDKIVQNHWETIKKAGEIYDVDPFYIASIISMEARDQKAYYLFDDQEPGIEKITLLESLAFGTGASEDNPVYKHVLNTLRFIQDHENQLKGVLPEYLTEETVDMAGAIAGENTSLGLGQVNIDTAKRFGLVRFAGKRLNERTPGWVVAAALNSPALNIHAIAAYTHELIDGYAQMQRGGLNLYMPDLSIYNPSSNGTQRKLEGDPIYKENFGVAFFGGAYTSAEYPEYNADPKRKYASDINLRQAVDIDNWGGKVAAYYEYYRENYKDLGLE